MLLGTRHITQGDTRRYTVSYREFLEKGATLLSPTAVLAESGLTSSIGVVFLDPTDTMVHIYITGGSALNEQFTVNVQVKDTNSEVVNDTIKFTVVSP